MTVSTTTSSANYTGNGVTLAFTVPFYFLDQTHLAVYRTTISTGVQTPLTLTTDYTVTGAGVGAGGTVTTTVAPTVDQQINIVRNVPLTQLVHYVPNDPFPAATHEGALDQLTMLVQQITELVGRAFVVAPGGSTSGPIPGAAARASKFLAFDASGVPYASAGTGGGDSALRTDLAASGGSALVTFLQAGAGAVARLLQTKLRDLGVSPQDFGAAADGSSDDGPKLRTALSSFASTGGRLRLPRATYRASASGGACLTIAKPMLVEGEGGIYTAINPALATSTDDTIYIAPSAAVDNTLLTLRGFALHDPTNGTRTGRYGVYLDTQVAGALVPKFTMRDMVIGQGSSYGFYHLNNSSNNVGGGMFCGLIENCQIKGGVRLENSGDSIAVVRNILSGSNGWGVWAGLVTGSSLLEIQGNNITTAFGAIRIEGGSRFRVIGNNIEHSAAGAVAHNDSALIDITGNGGAMYGGVIKENLISGFGSTDAVYGLRIDNCRGTEIAGNVFLSGAAGLTTGILIGGSCQDIRIGPNVFDAGITTQVVDNGVGTMGLLKTATLLNSWVAFAAGTATLKFIKNFDGTVHLFGSIKSGTTTNNTVLATLPVGFRPLETVRDKGMFTATGVDTLCEIAVNTGGDVVIVGVTSNVQLNINMTFPASTLANATSLE